MIDTGLLNENQKKAVLSDSRYLRIVAGAGSGKTRVLTMRIAHLIEDERVPAWKILAITFTNKAANEMKERIRGMLKEEEGMPWISTIHSLCVRILRQDIQSMGYPRNFTVMDADDQKSILKEAYKKYEVDTQQFSFGSLLDYISNNKAAEITPERAMEIAGKYSGEKIKAKVYEYYLKRQEELYALDFDDLIFWTVRMFRKFPDILAKWQNHFAYIHVDEFQDIDRMQYVLIRQLAGEKNSVYVVGDPDQTIYTWRGADVDIIMNFTKDFPGAETIMLNQNYRSTACILNGANSVIKNNKHRLKKELFTTNKSDEKIVHYSAVSDEYEAAWIAEEIRQLHAKGSEYRSMAILYRSNYLSRSIEKGLRDAFVPYIIFGGTRFYERQEIKDALCYLRMVVTGDDLSFRRIVNRPKRGIGQKTLETLAAKAEEKSCSMYEVLKKEPLFSAKTQKTLDHFSAQVESWRKDMESGEYSLDQLFSKIMTESGYQASLEENPEDSDRVENLKELIDDIRQFEKNNPEGTMDEYLQEVSLYGDRDEAQTADCVQMMTVHAAKGLEFDTVFVTDLNDGIFPNERAMNEGMRGVEEERRLAYVAFTRARKRLFLTEAGGFSFILQRVRTPSRFLEEIDPAYIRHIGGQRQEEASSGRRMAQNTRVRVEAEPKMDLIRTKSVLEPSKKGGVKTGDIVEHAKFGEGVVISVSGGIATIAFAYPAGVHKIAAGHPSLKKKNKTEG